MKDELAPPEQKYDDDDAGSREIPMDKPEQPRVKQFDNVVLSDEQLEFDLYKWELMVPEAVP